MTRHTKNNLAIAIAALLLVFTYYIRARAADEALLALERLHIDTLAHALGGVLVALLLERANFKLSEFRLLRAFASVTIGWELFELAAFPDSRELLATLPARWAIDSLTDILAALLGGALYARFFWSQKRPAPAAVRRRAH